MLTLKIIAYVLAMYGLSNLLVFGSGPYNILGKFRNLAKSRFPQIGNMLDCMMCTPTNIGFLMSIVDTVLVTVSFTPFNLLIGDATLWFLIIPMDGFLTSSTTWLIHTLQECLESFTEKNNVETEIIQDSSIVEEENL
jgi:hypothetical protein